MNGHIYIYRSVVHLIWFPTPPAPLVQNDYLLQRLEERGVNVLSEQRLDQVCVCVCVYIYIYVGNAYIRD